LVQSSFEVLTQPKGWRGRLQHAYVGKFDRWAWTNKSVLCVPAVVGRALFREGGDNELQDLPSAVLVPAIDLQETRLIQDLECPPRECGHRTAASDRSGLAERLGGVAGVGLRWTTLPPASRDWTSLRPRVLAYNSRRISCSPSSIGQEGSWTWKRASDLA
jgi:hypothetical protein